MGIIGFTGSNGQVRRARAADMLKELAGRDAIDWSRMKIFLVDERFGASSPSESNRELVRDSALKALRGRGIEFPVEAFVHPDPGIEDWEEARSDYEARLLAMFAS